MVLVTVGKDNAPKLFLVLDNVGKIGDNKVNAKHIVVREGKTAVNDEHIVAALVKIHILADFVKSA